MINELHVSLITQRKAVQEEGGRTAEARGVRGRLTERSRAPLASLCLSRRAAAAADNLRAPDVKATKRKKQKKNGKGQSQTAARLPGNNYIQSQIPFCRWLKSPGSNYAG